MNPMIRKWPEFWVRDNYHLKNPSDPELIIIIGSVIVPGIVCCTVTVLFFAAPLSKILHVVRTRNSECLPFPMIVANLIVCLQWVVYGIAIQDRFIQVCVYFWLCLNGVNLNSRCLTDYYLISLFQVPNVLGCILVSIQLSLFYFYPSRNTAGPLYRPLMQEA